MNIENNRKTDELIEETASLLYVKKLINVQNKAAIILNRRKLGARKQESAMANTNHIPIIDSIFCRYRLFSFKIDDHISKIAFPK